MNADEELYELGCQISALKFELDRVRRLALATLEEAILNPSEFVSAAALSELDRIIINDIEEHNSKLRAAISEIGADDGR